MIRPVDVYVLVDMLESDLPNGGKRAIRPQLSEV
jgi:hypothetical protein